MKSLEDQFVEVQRAYPDAGMTSAPDGAYLISIPAMALPAGWSKSATGMCFVVPTGYPYAAPDCFWTDGDLKLASGQPPQNAQIGNVNPAQPDATLLWFSWHLNAGLWKPSVSTLMTFIKVIKNRFDAVQ